MRDSNELTGMPRTPLAAAALLALLFSVGGAPARVASAQPPAATPAPSVLGAWKLNCENAAGMVVEISSSGTDAAVGRVKALGKATRFHYRVGEEVLKLKSGAGGSWTGQLLWKNENDEHRWQSITMKLVGQRLHGVSANEHCYEYMERAR